MAARGAPAARRRPRHPLHRDTPSWTELLPSGSATHITAETTRAPIKDNVTSTCVTRTPHPSRRAVTRLSEESTKFRAGSCEDLGKESIKCIEEHGGDIVKFAGDAVSAIFVAETGMREAVTRAAVCALELHHRVHGYTAWTDDDDPSHRASPAPAPSPTLAPRPSS